MGVPDAAEDEEDSELLAAVEVVAEVVEPEAPDADAVVSVLEPAVVVVAVSEAPESQLAELGRSLTPAVLQIWRANFRAAKLRETVLARHDGDLQEE